MFLFNASMRDASIWSAVLRQPHNHLHKISWAPGEHTLTAQAAELGVSESESKHNCSLGHIAYVGKLSLLSPQKGAPSTSLQCTAPHLDFLTVHEKICLLKHTLQAALAPRPRRTSGGLLHVEWTTQRCQQRRTRVVVCGAAPSRLLWTHRATLSSLANRDYEYQKS